MKNNIEILAPAGSPETVLAGLRCGANAVYIGGKSFSARQNALNFSSEDLKEAVRLCHLYNAKLHVAVNTMVFDSQLEELVAFVKELAEIGVDAVIVQDLGVLNVIKTVAPELPVHASTQLTIHSVQGAKIAKELGFSRVVLSRELSADEISEICKLGIETEVFVHGALCMSVSGQCYMSALIGSRSANRGLCAQACRLSFSADKNNRNYSALSLKDLCLVNHTEELKNMGVNSFKIEGRMKRPEYVAMAVTSFRKALNGEKPDIEKLRAVFSRSGFTDGYFTGKRKDMFGTRQKEDVVSARTVLNEITALYAKPFKISAINFNVEVFENLPVKVSVSDDFGNMATVYGDIPQIAKNRPLNLEQLEKQFSKLGDTVYTFGKLEAEIHENIMLPASALNALRRKAVEALDNLRISRNTPHYSVHKINLNFPKLLILKYPEIRVQLHSFSQLNKYIIEHSDKIILPLIEIEKNNIPDNLKEKIIIEPPRFIVNELDIISRLGKLFNDGFKKLLCNNIAYCSLKKFERYGDFGLNAGNSLALKQLAEMGLKDCTVSFELKLSQIYSLADYLRYGMIVYGRLPSMLVRNCPVKNQIGCRNCTKTLYDRTNRKFRMRCNGNYAEILNPDILKVNRNDICDTDFITLIFDDEKPAQIEKVLDYYLGKGDFPETDLKFTNGLYKRGVI